MVRVRQLFIVSRVQCGIAKYQRPIFAHCTFGFLIVFSRLCTVFCQVLYNWFPIVCRQECAQLVFSCTVGFLISFLSTFSIVLFFYCVWASHCALQMVLYFVLSMFCWLPYCVLQESTQCFIQTHGFCTVCTLFDVFSMLWYVSSECTTYKLFHVPVSLDFCDVGWCV